MISTFYPVGSFLCATHFSTYNLCSLLTEAKFFRFFFSYQLSLDLIIIYCLCSFCLVYMSMISLYVLINKISNWWDCKSNDFKISIKMINYFIQTQGEGRKKFLSLMPWFWYMFSKFWLDLLLNFVSYLFTQVRSSTVFVSFVYLFPSQAMCSPDEFGTMDYVIMYPYLIEWVWIIWLSFVLDHL